MLTLWKNRGTLNDSMHLNRCMLALQLSCAPRDMQWNEEFECRFNNPGPYYVEKKKERLGQKVGYSCEKLYGLFRTVRLARTAAGLLTTKYCAASQEARTSPV